MADQEFLASFAVEIDEQGVSRLQAVLEENRDLANEVAAAFSAATDAIREYAETLPDLFSEETFGNGSDVPSILEGQGSSAGGKSLQLDLDTTDAQEDLASFRKEAAKPLEMSGNGSGMLNTARSAYNSIKAIFSTPITLKVNIVKTEGSDDEFIDPSDENPVLMSTGGRFTRPTDVQVAEDGDAEYIIPVKKEDRAIPLLRQLLSELSPAARESLNLGDAALPLSGGLSAGMAAPVTVNQTSQNVSAPVTIDVHASSASAEQIGQSVYNAAERYLLRTMRSVFV